MKPSVFEHMIYSVHYRVEHPASGRYMEVHTTEPVVVNYSGYYLDVLLKGMTCKDDAVYQQSGGLLFMPQGYPDAVNHVSLLTLEVLIKLQQTTFVYFFFQRKSGLTCHVNH